MKKKLVVLCLVLACSNCVMAGADMVNNDRDNIDRIADVEDGTQKAELLNDINNDKDYATSLKSILDQYYDEDGSLTGSKDEYNEFKSTVDKRAVEVLEDYELAAEERKHSYELDYVADEIIVSFDKSVSDERIYDILVREGDSGVTDTELLKISDELPQDTRQKIQDAQEGIGYKAVRVKLNKSQTTQKAIREFKKFPEVKKAAVNEIIRIEESVSNDAMSGEQWYLDNINVEDAWDAVKSANTSSSIRVAVVDTGIEMSHSDLKSKIIKSLSADITTGVPILLKNMEVTYAGAHGTNVAGIISAKADNNIGIAGISGISSANNNYNSRIMAVKVFNNSNPDDVYTTSHDIAEGVRYAVSKGADVINISIGGYGYSEEIEDAIECADRAGVTVVASAGNHNTDLRHYPSSTDHVISVIATNQQKNKADFSNYGLQYNDICAPGTDIFTTGIGNGYITSAGTSFSSPIVAATVSLMKGVNDELTTAQIEEILKTTAEDIGEAGPDEQTAYGLVNAGLAVQRAKWYTFSNKKPAVSSVVSGSKGKISLEFDTIGNEERYNIYRADSKNGVYVQVGNGKIQEAGKISFTDKSVCSGGKYYYKVRVKTKYGNTYKHSLYSEVVSCLAK